MTNMDTIRIVFEFTTKYGVFRDALYLQEGHSLTDEQIAEMQRERLNNWFAAIEAPPVEELPVEEAVPVEEEVQVEEEVPIEEVTADG